MKISDRIKAAYRRQRPHRHVIDGPTVEVASAQADPPAPTPELVQPGGVRFSPSTQAEAQHSGENFLDEAGRQRLATSVGADTYLLVTDDGTGNVKTVVLSKSTGEIVGEQG